MNKFLAVVKILVNIIFALVYIVFFQILVGFFMGLGAEMGLYDEPVRKAGLLNDPVEIVAVVTTIVVLLLTFLLRKWLYLSVFTDAFFKKEYEARHKKKLKVKEKEFHEAVERDELEIFVNKEI